VDLSGLKKACIRWGAHWRNLANTIEPSMCGSDTAFLGRIALTTGSEILSIICKKMKRGHVILNNPKSLINLHTKLKYLASPVPKNGS